MKRMIMLSGYLIVVMTTIGISEWKAISKQSSVQLENRRPIVNVINFDDSVCSSLKYTLDGYIDILISVTPSPILIGERELVSIQVTDLEISTDKIDTNRWGIKLTTDEIDLLAKIVWTEARGESNKGQQAVIEVVFNRMNHLDFEGSLYDVLSAKGQFCSWKTRNKAIPTDKEYKNIDKVLSGKTDLFGNNKLYFSTSPRNDKNPEQIGNHWFCDYEYDSKIDKR